MLPRVKLRRLHRKHVMASLSRFVGSDFDDLGQLQMKPFRPSRCGD